ncbi:hypothetical protein K3495_g5069 [Podosphaera aphanis]|nr:hypothetical protein K3495_g5069 [Podosphaera aphanis]
MYSDVSGYAAGCCITQKRRVQGSSFARQQEHLILFDSFILSKTERNYGTYKRELFGIVSFCRKVHWMFMSSDTSIIFTDHKPLTHFLDSHLVHGIYSRWAEELNILNVRIEYIPGEKSRIADTLSRTIFPTDDCSVDETLSTIGSLTINKYNQSKWVWKDGIGGYQNLLDAYCLKTQDDKLSDQVMQVFSASMAESSQLPGQTIPPFSSKENIPLGGYGPKDIAFEVYLSTVTVRVLMRGQSYKQR